MALLSAPIRDQVVEGGPGYLIKQRWSDWFLSIWQSLTGITHYRTAEYASVSFSANGGGTWSVPEAGFLLCQTIRAGDRMRIDFNFQQGTISGAGNELRFTIPALEAVSPVAYSKEFTGFIMITGANGTGVVGFAVTGSLAGGHNDKIRLFRPGFASWANDAGTAGVRGCIEFKVTI